MTISYKFSFTLCVLVSLIYISGLCNAKRVTAIEKNGKIFTHELFDSDTTGMSPTMNVTTIGMKDILSDSFKFGLYSAAVLTLHIILLIALIFFAISGTIAYICSITNCKHFFTGTGGVKERTQLPFSNSFNHRQDMALRSWEDMKPIAQGLHMNYDKYNDGYVENY